MLRQSPLSMLRVFLLVLNILRMNLKFILMNLNKLVLELSQIHTVLSFTILRLHVGLIMDPPVIHGIYLSRVLPIIISGPRNLLMNNIMR